MMGDCLVKGLCVPLDSMIVTVSKKGSMIHITFQARKEKKINSPKLSRYKDDVLLLKNVRFG